MDERAILELLDRRAWQALTRGRLDAITRRVQAAVNAEALRLLAWEPIDLSHFDPLPAEIRSAWVFVLRAGTVTGAERHPNSVQRMMSFRGRGDMQTFDGAGWRSHQLFSSDTLADRWITIPENTWHRPVVGRGHDWIVVSFQTATAAALIEERPDNDDYPTQVASAEVYAGRSLR